MGTFLAVLLVLVPSKPALVRPVGLADTRAECVALAAKAAVADQAAIAQVIAGAAGAKIAARCVYIPFAEPAPAARL